MAESRLPVVVICADGTEPAYVDSAIDHGCMPTMARFQREGAYYLVPAAIPSFTNPNNMTIVDRPAAGGARHFGQLLLRRPARRGGDDGPPALFALRVVVCAV